MPWSDNQSKQLFAEYRQCYANGDWMATPLAHVNKRGTSLDEKRRRLGLDPTKKTAFIFPHVPWDSSSCWGDDLFQDYQEWLVETGSRYVWTHPDVEAAREALYANVAPFRDAEAFVTWRVKTAILRYYHALNLIDFNDRLLEHLPAPRS